MLGFLLACHAPIVTAPTAELAWHCAYENPYSHEPECREYGGTWTQAEVAAACDGVFKGVTGELGSGGCPRTEHIGTCTADDDGALTRIWFYSGEPVVTGRLCRLFLRGAWEPTGLGEGSTSLAPATVDPGLLRVNDSVRIDPVCSDDACLEALVAQRGGITLSPTAAPPVAGIVIYPGAQVDPRAYVPLALDLVEGGLEVVIVPMPDGYALGGFDRAADIIAARPDVARWFVGGHSMGGVMAAHFHKTHPGVDVAGLILWGAYTDPDDDLSGEDLPVLSIFGLKDGLVTPEEIEDGRDLLPDRTVFVPIRGGNHAQFGHYGTQEGDRTAAISPASQQEQISATTLHFVRRVLGDAPEPSPDHLRISALDATWCEVAQPIIAGMPALDEAVSIQGVPHVDPVAFARSKPELTEGALMLPGILLDGGNSTVLSMPPIHARQLACKFKTGPYLSAATGQPSAESACAAANAAVLEHVLDQIDPELALAYRASPPGLRFAADAEQPTGLDWLTTETTETLEGDEVVVVAPRLRVGIQDDLPESSQQVIYCKLWTPGRALAWILAHTTPR